MIAIAGLASSASAAQSNILTNILKNLNATPGAAPAVLSQDVLGALSNPKAYREALLVTCNQNAGALGSNACIMQFDTVPTGHVLQIDKANCLGGTSGTAILFNTQLKVDAAHLVGFVLQPYDGAGGSDVHGPYYFRAGEKPKLLATGSAPTDRAFCSVFGTLWQAN